MTAQASPDPRSRFIDLAEQIGAGVLGVASVAGGMGVLLGRIIARFFPPRVDYPELRRNLYKMASSRCRS